MIPSPFLETLTSDMYYTTPHQAIILAGGRGTRMMEVTHAIPKPMIGLGGKPLLEHIIDIYSAQGVHEFVIPVGYRKEVVFQYFMDKFENTYEMDTENKVLIGGYGNERLVIVDTGLDTMTGGRIKRVQAFMNNAPFYCTYGDGLANVNLFRLSEIHRHTIAQVTLTAVHPIPRFGAIKFGEEGMITEFGEKTDHLGGYINGGFMVCEPSVFDEIAGDDTNFEADILSDLAFCGELFGYKHDGFWYCVDTMRDLQYLQDLVATGDIKWLNFG